MTSLNIIGDLMEQQRRKEEEEKAAKEIEQTLAGRAAAAGLENTVRTQGSMDMPSFQETFRRGISPAREILSNVMAGVSSKMLGTPFKPVRQRMFEEYERQEKLRQNEEKYQTLAQQHAATLQARVVDQQEKNQLTAQRNQTQRDFVEGRLTKMLDDQINAATSLEQRDRLIKLKEEYAPLEQALTEARTKKVLADIDKLPDAFTEIGRRQAAAEMMEAGENPEDPKNQLKLLRRATEFGLNLFEERRKINAAHPSANAGLAGLRPVPTKNAYGEIEMRVVDIRKLGPGGTANLGKSWDDPKDRGEIEDAGLAISTASDLTQQIAQNPRALRTLGQALGEVTPLLERLGQVRGAAEATLAANLGIFLFNRIKALSGVQFSDNERAAQKAINASPLDTPVNALSKLVSYQVWESVARASRILEIPDKANAFFDAGSVRLFEMKVIEDLARIGKLDQYRPPTADEIIQRAAKARGKTLIFERGKLKAGPGGIQ